MASPLPQPRNLPSRRRRRLVEIQKRENLTRIYRLKLNK